MVVSSNKVVPIKKLISDNQDVEQYNAHNDRRRTEEGRARVRSYQEGSTAAAPKLNNIDQLALDDTQPNVLISITGELLKVNDAYALLTERATGAFLAGSADAIGQGPVRALLEVIEDVLAADTTLRLEEHIEIEGREHIFLTRYIPIRREDNSINALAAVYEDITPQVMAMRKANLTEARFRDFARASSDWFFECDRNMRITHLSERFTATVGQPASLFIGAEISQIGDFGRNLDGEDIGPRSIARRKPFRDQLFIIKGSDSTDRRFHLSAVPIFEHIQGSFNGYRGVGMDVSDRYRQAKEAEAIRKNLEGLLQELTKKNIALDMANDRAQAALATKNDFLATMSHELRTPLNAIIGFASSFENKAFGDLNERYQDYARDIRLAGEHLLGLINDILDVAVLESGDLSLHPMLIDVDSILRDVAQMIAPAAQKRSLKLNMPASSGLEVVSDKRRLIQILINLLNNAVKFTPSQRSIGIKVTTTKNDMVQITVWDEGIGIAKKNQDLVFAKFEQIKGHIYNREQDGTGLGLHISRELARRMGGDLTVQSTVDVGSHFHLTLPLQDQEDSMKEDDNFI